MGCWNGTCGVSHTPILAGDKTRFFFVFTQDYSDDPDDSSSYPTDRWAPVGPPLLGDYDDYGGVEVKDSLLTKFYESYFAAHNLVFGKRTGLYVTNSKPPFEIDSLIKIAERGGASVSVMGLKQRFKEMLVHEHVYQTMVQTEFTGSWWDEVHRSRRKHYHAMIPGHLKHLEDMLHFEKDRKSLMEALATDIDLKSLKGLLRRPFGGNGPGLTDFNQFISDIYSKKNAKKVKGLLEEFADFLTFNSSLHYTRTAYGPQTGAGSQESNMQMLLAVGRAVVEINEARKREWIRDNPGEEYPD
jgi:hypothetical protein